MATGNEPVHPAANIFPMMDQAAYESLRDDIRENRQQEPIVYWRQQLIDGRNRLKACRELGIEPETCEIDDDQDPVAWIVSANLHRRHLTTTQRAMVAANLKSLYAKDAEKRMKAGKKSDPMENLPQGSARDAAGAALGVSGRSVDLAAKVLDKGVPELVEMVKRGEVSISTAAALADAKKETQERAVQLGKHEVGRVAYQVATRKRNTGTTPTTRPARRRQAAQPPVRLSALHKRAMKAALSQLERAAAAADRYKECAVAFDIILDVIDGKKASGREQEGARP